MMYLILAGCSLDEKPGKNWVQEAGGLPDYICRVARAVKRNGHTTSEAIRIAIGAVRNWAHGHSSGGKGTKSVHPQTQAKGAAAAAAWEALKAKSHALHAAKQVAASRQDLDLVCFCADLFNVEDVERAYRTSGVAQRMFAGSNAGPGRHDPDTPPGYRPSSYAVQVWTQFLIATGDLDNDADIDYYKVPFSVSQSTGEVTFGEPVEVHQEWVDAAGKPVGSPADGDDLTDDELDDLGVPSDDMSGADLGDDELDELLNLANSWNEQYEYADRVLALANSLRKPAAPPTPVLSSAAEGSAVSSIVAKYQRKSDVVELAWSEAARKAAEEARRLHHHSKVIDTGSKKSGYDPGEASRSGSRRWSDAFVRKAAADSSHPSHAKAVEEAKSRGLSASAAIAPGKYHTKNGSAVGKAHMIVGANGSGHYVNSRGEATPLSAAQVARRHAAGMNHEPGGKAPQTDAEFHQMLGSGKVGKKSLSDSEVSRARSLGWSFDSSGRPVSSAGVGGSNLSKSRAQATRDLQQQRTIAAKAHAARIADPASKLADVKSQWERGVYDANDVRAQLGDAEAKKFLAKYPVSKSAPVPLPGRRGSGTPAPASLGSPSSSELRSQAETLSEHASQVGTETAHREAAAAHEKAADSVKGAAKDQHMQKAASHEAAAQAAAKSAAQVAAQNSKGLPHSGSDKMSGFGHYAQPWLDKIKSPEEKSYLSARVKQIEAGTPRPSGMSGQHGVDKARVGKLESALAHVTRGHVQNGGKLKAEREGTQGSAAQQVAARAGSSVSALQSRLEGLKATGKGKSAGADSIRRQLASAKRAEKK